VADLEKDDYRQIQEQGGGEGRSADGRAVEKVLNRQGKRCAKAGGMENPESGKDAARDQIKPRRIRIIMRRSRGEMQGEHDACQLVAFRKKSRLSLHEHLFFASSGRWSVFRPFALNSFR
jgi:hypothetical protein